MTIDDIDPPTATAEQLAKLSAQHMVDGHSFALPVALMRVVIAARDEWWLDREAKDDGEKHLMLALIDAFGGFPSEECSCEDPQGCDECPTRAEIAAWRAETRRELGFDEEAAP